MRYRGGGVGHIYMGAIEVWLAETGWGSNDTSLSVNEDVNLESGKEGLDGTEDLEGSENSKSGGNSEYEGSEDEVSESGTAPSSEEESGSDIDPDVEYMSSEGDEETMDGEYGFSSL